MANTALKEIYLDCNATTPVLKVAAQAAQDAMESVYGNPSSNHITGLKARYILESTRTLAKKVIGANNNCQIIFVSGATEGIQTAIFSTLYHLKQQNRTRDTCYLLYGATEHKAVPNSLIHWNEVLGIGAEVIAIPVDKKGLLDTDFIAKHVPKAAMICTMAVNNETGVIQDLSALDNVIRQNNPHVPWMVDCVQALGKLDLALEKTSIDYAPFSGHKIYAPKGIGMLYAKAGAALSPIIAGGGQEGGLRSGTENLPGVAAFGAILKELANPDSVCFKEHSQLETFRTRLVDTLKACFPGIAFNMPFDHSVPTTINFSIEGFPSKEIMDLFDAAQIRVSSGSACSSSVTRSFVLDAMGMPAWQSEAAIRLSFGPTATEQVIEDACARITLASKALTHSCLILPTWDDQHIESPRQDGLIQLKKGDTCTWIIADQESQSCVIIDPVEALGERLEKFVQCQNFTVKAIIDTHSHEDHISCRRLLQKILQTQMSLDINDYDNLGWPKESLSNISLENGEQASTIVLGKTVLARYHTPGHTDDSASYFLGMADNCILHASNIQYAFIGDTLLIGGMGRTDFASSSSHQLFESLKTLGELIHHDTVLCTAHDYSNHFATTLNAECQHNSLLRQVLHEKLTLPNFVQQKNTLDQTLNDQQSSDIICGVTNTEPEHPDMHILPEQLHAYLDTHPDVRILDVREAHEYQLFNNWNKLNIQSKPENIPLTRVSDFIGKLLQENHSKQQNLLFICRSGARSSRLAATFRRLGFFQAAHVSGGIALNCL